MQVLHTSVKLKEQLLEFPYSNFMDSMKGYTPVKNTKKLVKYFEKMQNQLNISEDKVGIASCKLFAYRIMLRFILCRILTFSSFLWLVSTSYA